ncbi:MAG: F0F1 ATP synthase subunit delta [Gammaproteobacteria bacterium]|nr:F0F1 ATP synthase subunit delta [Gammaproteobacteria bacterium]
MAVDATTIARPYAEALFSRAEETNALDLWSESLELLATVAEDPTMATTIADPKFDRADLIKLLQDVCGDKLSSEGQNLVNLLVANGRLTVLPEIAILYEKLKAESQQALKAHVRSAYEFTADQEQQIAEGLKRKLGLNVTITSEQDQELIGGVHIRAGDLVIDGSIKGKIEQLANELGI